MKQKLITTLKWQPRSKTTKRLAIRVYEGSELFKVISKYQTLSHAIFYQSHTDGKKFDVDFNPRSGEFRKTSIQKVNGRSCIDIAFVLKSNMSAPKEFKKATELHESNIDFGENAFSIVLESAQKSSASFASTNSSDKKLDQIIDLLNNVYHRPSVDPHELVEILSGKTADKSSQLANEIVERLTRSDDFMNRIAETVGFKLASTISTRMNRLDESMKSLTKEQANKTEKTVTHNVYDLFKEAGWLK